MNAVTDTRRSPQALVYRKWYQTKRWYRIRHARLNADPICKMCKDAPSTIVDHIVPHRGSEHMFFDFANTQGLCKPCHDIHKQREEALGYSTDVDATGWPSDPAHRANRT